MHRRCYTAYAGCAVTSIIAVKFGTAHGRSRPEVGSGFPIESYGSRGVSRLSLIIGNSQQKIITPTALLRPKHNFYSLTVCNLDQYLPNGSEKSGVQAIGINAEAYYQFPFVISAARSKNGKPVCAVLSGLHAGLYTCIYTQTWVSSLCYCLCALTEVGSPMLIRVTLALGLTTGHWSTPRAR